MRELVETIGISSVWRNNGGVYECRYPQIRFYFMMFIHFVHLDYKTTYNKANRRSGLKFGEQPRWGFLKVCQQRHGPDLSTRHWMKHMGMGQNIWKWPSAVSGEASNR